MYMCNEFLWFGSIIGEEFHQPDFLMPQKLGW